MNAEADVWVAGDVASFWDRALGRRRIEHWGRPSLVLRRTVLLFCVSLF